MSGDGIDVSSFSVAMSALFWIMSSLPVTVLRFHPGSRSARCQEQAAPAEGLRRVMLGSAGLV
jgi:hypothetical protein